MATTSQELEQTAAAAATAAPIMSANHANVDDHLSQTINKIFSPKEAQTYIQSHLSGTTDAQADILAKTLGYLPLALSQAVSYIYANGCLCTIDKYIELFHKIQKNQRALLETIPEEERYTKILYTAWYISVDVLQSKIPTSVDILNHCAFLVPELIPMPLLKVILQEMSEAELLNAISVLKTYSFVDTLQDQKEGNISGINVHPILQKLVRLHLSVEKRKQIIQKITLAIINCYPQDKPKMQDYSFARLLIPHLEAIVKEITNIEEMVRDKAIILRLAADAYDSLGNYQKQKELLKEALAIQIKYYGTREHIEIATTLNSLAIIYKQLGNIRKAKELSEEALAIQIKLYGTREHVEIAKTLNKLAAVYWELGDTDKAKELLEEALAIQIKQYGTREHVAVARTLNGIGTAYRQLGSIPKAKELLEEALAIQIKHYGTREHIDIAKPLHNLAGVYWDLDDTSKAKELSEEALAIQIKHYGTRRHIEVATTLTNLANTYGKLKDTRKQKELLSEVITIETGHYGTTQHPDVAIAMTNLALAYAMEYNFQQTLELLKESCKILLNHPQCGINHPITQKTLAAKRHIEQIAQKVGLFAGSHARLKEKTQHSQVSRSPCIDGESVRTKKAKEESLRSARAQGIIGPSYIPGWKLKNVRDDGNCFYRAVIHQMKLMHHNFLTTIAEGTKPRNSLRLHIQGREFKDGEWADHPEIKKLARKFNFIVAILDTRDSEHHFIYHYIDADNNYQYSLELPNLPGRQIIKLAFTGNHYLSIEAEDGARVAVAQSLRKKPSIVQTEPHVLGTIGSSVNASLPPLPQSHKHKVFMTANGATAKNIKIVALLSRPFRQPPNPWNLPTSIGPIFTGREQELEVIHRTAITTTTTTTNQANIISQYITGINGIGKTTLAVEYAHSSFRANTYDFIAFIKASSQTTLHSDFQILGIAFGILPAEINAIASSDIIKFVYQRLATYNKVLIIFDDAKSLRIIRDLDEPNVEKQTNFEPPEPPQELTTKIHWLITTDNPHFSSQIQAIELHALTPKEAKDDIRPAPTTPPSQTTSADSITHVRLSANGARAERISLTAVLSRQFLHPTNPWNLPNSIGPIFTGRRPELAMLHEIALSTNQASIINQSIGGLGGVGKTTLAVEYAHKSLATNTYDFIAFIRANSELTLYNDFQSLALAFGMLLEDMKASSARNLIRFVYQGLATYKKVLLIFDNAEDVNTIKGLNNPIVERQANFEPPQELKTKIHWLITTRNQHFSSQMQVIRLNVFTPEDARDYIKKRLSWASNEQANALAKTLGYFPLALSQAVSYIHESDGTCTIEQYLELFNGAQTSQRELLDTISGEEPYAKTIYTTWYISINALQNKSTVSVAVLNHCAFLGPYVE